MAKLVGYWDNLEDPEKRAEAFSEGPFVVVPTMGCYRVEVELVGHCPIIPDSTIFDLREKLGLDIYKRGREETMQIVDRLNLLVKEGRIICDGRRWYAPEMEKDIND